jgi:general stress protein 26
MSTNSIDQNQSEENHADLEGEEALQKIRELVEEAQTCFFCTGAQVEGSNGARPMSVQQVDDEGNLWFLSASDSHKNRELERDPAVVLYFQGSAHSDFLHLKGIATISDDREKIAELWEPIIGTWFTGGVDDPRITAIKVTPSEGYYWDNKHGNAIAALKIVVGAVLHKTMDDSIEGKLEVAV